MKVPWSLSSQKIFGWVLLALGALCIAFDLSGFDVPRPVFHATWVAFVLWAISAVISEQAVVFVTKRTLEALLTVWLIATATFFLLRYLPGGPFDMERALSDDVKAAIEAKYGLNQPLFQQYISYLSALTRFDFGLSYKYIGRSVQDIILETLPVSFQLGFYSLIVAFVLGIPLGVYAAARQNSWVDHMAMVIAISGVALPSFMIGPLLVLIFSFGIPWSIFSGFLPPALWESPLHYLLPVVTLGIRPAAVIARMTRASVLDVIQSDFVRTAKAKGLSESVVLYKHVLQNALIPILTISGPLVAGILSGSFVIEIIFAIPGMGKHFVQSVTNRDYPLILGVTLIYSVLLIGANLVVDLLYSVVDPRIRLKG